MSADLSAVKVLVFDVFGSVVDWRGSIERDLSVWQKQKCASRLGGIGAGLA